MTIGSARPQGNRRRPGSARGDTWRKYPQRRILSGIPGIPQGRSVPVSTFEKHLRPSQLFPVLIHGHEPAGMAVLGGNVDGIAASFRRRQIENDTPRADAEVISFIYSSPQYAPQNAGLGPKKNELFVNNKSAPMRHGGWDFISLLSLSKNK